MSLGSHITFVWNNHRYWVQFPICLYHYLHGWEKIVEFHLWKLLSSVKIIVTGTIPIKHTTSQILFFWDEDLDTNFEAKWRYFSQFFENINFWLPLPYLVTYTTMSKLEISHKNTIPVWDEKNWILRSFDQFFAIRANFDGL